MSNEEKMRSEREEQRELNSQSGSQSTSTAEFAPTLAREDTSTTTTQTTVNPEETNSNAQCKSSNSISEKPPDTTLLKILQEIKMLGEKTTTEYKNISETFHAIQHDIEGNSLQIKTLRQDLEDSNKQIEELRNDIKLNKITAEKDKTTKPTPILTPPPLVNTLVPKLQAFNDQNTSQISTQSLMSKLSSAKAFMPKFDEKQILAPAFLDEIEKFYDLTNISKQNEKVQAFKFSMLGDASVWWSTIQNTIKNWEDLKGKFMKHYYGRYEIHMRIKEWENTTLTKDKDIIAFTLKGLSLLPALYKNEDFPELASRVLRKLPRQFRDSLLFTNTEYTNQEQLISAIKKLIVEKVYCDEEDRRQSTYQQTDSQQARHYKPSNQNTNTASKTYNPRYNSNSSTQSDNYRNDARANTYKHQYQQSGNMGQTQNRTTPYASKPVTTSNDRSYAPNDRYYTPGNRSQTSPLPTRSVNLVQYDNSAHTLHSIQNTNPYGIDNTFIAQGPNVDVQLQRSGVTPGEHTEN